MPKLEYIELKSNQSPTHTVIWLHGLGADGHDFLPVAEQLNIPNSLPIKFIFPHAPIQPVTLNGGMSMRSWYDIYALHEDAKEDEAGIRASHELLTELIEMENQNGVPNERIFLVGFSQGCAMVLSYLCQHNIEFAGVIGLSGYLAIANTIDTIGPNALKTPIFMGHGSNDQVLPIKFGKVSSDKLSEYGFNLAWHDYPMDHSVCPQEVLDIKAWLQSRI